MVEIYEPFDKISPELRAKWIFILEVAYNEPQRHYHTLSHIRSMFERLNEIRRSTPFSAQELQILQLSIWFHDVVYETTSEAGSNEYLSALKFGDYARDIGLENDIVRTVQYLILCTWKHGRIPEYLHDIRHKKCEEMRTLFEHIRPLVNVVRNVDLVDVFLDLDLSILGAAEDEYDNYASQIRKEYEQYSWEQYCRGRTAVLESFLGRKRLFFSDYFHGKYEEYAKENISRELQNLEHSHG